MMNIKYKGGDGSIVRWFEGYRRLEMKRRKENIRQVTPEEKK